MGIIDYTITVHTLLKMFKNAGWLPDQDTEMDLFRIIERNHDPEEVYSKKVHSSKITTTLIFMNRKLVKHARRV